MSKRVGDYFDHKAAKFDSIYVDEAPVMRRVNQFLRAAVYERYEVALAESGDVTDKMILDVGCGPGHYSVEYAQRGAKRVVGLDMSSEMLALARQLAASRGVADRCEFVQADFLASPPTGTFDVVLAMGVFDYVADAGTFLRRMADVSRGRVIASFPGRNLLRMHLRRIRYSLHNCPVFFYTESELKAIAEGAGLAKYELLYNPHSGGGWVLVGDVPKA